MELLTRALAEMQSRGRRSTAAGLSAQMRILDPSFSAVGAGYPNFRALLEAAGQAELIEVSPREGQSDVDVHLLGSKHGAATPLNTDLLHVKPDLWRGFLNWNPAVIYTFDVATGSTSKFEGSAGEYLDSVGRIRLDSVSREQQLVWMKDFANSEAGLVRDALTSALAESEPIQGFSRELKSSASVAKRWKKHLRLQVLVRIQKWAADNDIAIQELSTPTPAPTRGIAAPSEPEPTEEGVRARILEVLSAMPLSELLKLSVPLEYSLRL